MSTRRTTTPLRASERSDYRPDSPEAAASGETALEIERTRGAAALPEPPDPRQRTINKPPPDVSSIDTIDDLKLKCEEMLGARGAVKFNTSRSSYKRAVVPPKPQGFDKAIALTKVVVEGAKKLFPDKDKRNAFFAEMRTDERYKSFERVRLWFERRKSGTAKGRASYDDALKSYNRHSYQADVLIARIARTVHAGDRVGVERLRRELSALHKAWAQVVAALEGQRIYRRLPSTAEISQDIQDQVAELRRIDEQEESLAAEEEQACLDILHDRPPQPVAFREDGRPVYDEESL